MNAANQAASVVTERLYQVKPRQLADKNAQLLVRDGLPRIADICDETSGRIQSRQCLKRDVVAVVL